MTGTVLCLLVDAINSMFGISAYSKSEKSDRKVGKVGSFGAYGVTSNLKALQLKGLSHRPHKELGCRDPLFRVSTR